MCDRAIREEKNNYIFAWLYRADGLILANWGIMSRLYTSAFNDILTNTHDSSLEFRRRHSLEDTSTDIEVEQACELHGPLLNLKFRARREARQHACYPLLLCDRGRGACGHLRDGGEDELAGEVVGVGRVKNRKKEVDKLDVGDLGRSVEQTWNVCGDIDSLAWAGPRLQAHPRARSRCTRPGSM